MGLSSPKQIHAAPLGAAFLLATLGTAQAQDLRLVQPIDCSLGTDCVIQQYVDHDAGPSASDFRCGPQSYDGHKGTDFRLLDESDLGDEVAVLAAAAGTVTGLRDGMADHLQSWPNAPDITGRECGNGLVIDHGNGWETQYCHLAQGSLAVTRGQRVEAGTRLGTVGASGESEFPHLHLSLRKDGAVVDPFDPDGQITCGAPSTDTLWADPLGPSPGGLLTAGFSDRVPEFEAIKAGRAHEPALAAGSPALVLWGYLHGLRAGDAVRLTITGPMGAFSDQTVPLDRDSAQIFRAAGRRAPPGGWPPGRYEGTVSLIRDGAVLSTLTAETRQN